MLLSCIFCISTYLTIYKSSTGPILNGGGACMQAFSQKGVQASLDAHRTKNGRLWTPKFWGKREIIFNDFPKFNISETK
jgi:hypothetical protein